MEYRRLTDDEQLQQRTRFGSTRTDGDDDDGGDEYGFVRRPPPPPGEVHQRASNSTVYYPMQFARSL